MVPSYQVVAKVTLNECSRTEQLITFQRYVEHTEGLSLLRGQSQRSSAGYIGVNR